MYAAIELAKNTTKQLGYNHCHFEVDEAIHFVNRYTQKGIRPDVVIVDPPRAGLGKALCKALLSLAPQKCIYVSCNPATFARDIGRLHPYFQLIEKEL